MNRSFLFRVGFLGNSPDGAFDLLAEGMELGKLKVNFRVDKVVGGVREWDVVVLFPSSFPSDEIWGVIKQIHSIPKFLGVVIACHGTPETGTDWTWIGKELTPPNWLVWVDISSPSCLLELAGETRRLLFSRLVYDWLAVGDRAAIEACGKELSSYLFSGVRAALLNRKWPEKRSADDFPMDR